MKKETMHSKSINGRSTDTLGAFIEQRMDLDPLFGAVNIRYDHNSKSEGQPKLSTFSRS